MSLLRIYADAPDESSIRDLVSLIERGEVVVLPTSTGYSYACHALQPKAIDKLYRIKGYTNTKRPLAILCADLAEAAKYCRVNDGAFRYIREHGGRYTFILPAVGMLPKSIRQRKELGLRLAEHPIALAVLRELQAPLMLASIPCPEDEDPQDLCNPDLIAELNDARHKSEQAALVVDAGIVERRPSTIVDCCSEEYNVIRQG